MKRLWKILLLTALLGVTATVWAWADTPSAAGIGYTVKDTNLTVTEGTAGSYTIGEETYDHFITGADKLTFTYTAPTEGSYYLVLALDSATADKPTDSSIVYIDQSISSGSSVSFAINSNLILPGNAYYVYITGPEKGYTKDGYALKFSSYVEYILGDANGNGSIGGDDALEVLQAVAHIKELTGSSFLAADVNKSNTIGGDDALMILQAVAHIIEL